MLGEGPGVRPSTESGSQILPHTVSRRGWGGGGNWRGKGGHQRPALAHLPASGKRESSPGLPGKVLDIHVLVLGQLLSDGLDLALEVHCCPGWALPSVET